MGSGLKILPWCCQMIPPPVKWSGQPKSCWPWLLLLVCFLMQRSESRGQLHKRWQVNNYFCVLITGPFLSYATPHLSLFFYPWNRPSILALQKMLYFSLLPQTEGIVNLKMHVIGRTWRGPHPNTAVIFPDKANDGGNSENKVPPDPNWMCPSHLVLTPNPVSHTPLYWNSRGGGG